MTYASELTAAMSWLGQKEDTIFIGQQVCYPGNALFKTLEGVPIEKRIELPVAEEMQMGMSIGMAMTGKTVISIYPRFDFLLCAMNQLVNHLDKDLYKMPGRVIIRTCVGSTKPMHPGAQHCGNYVAGLTMMLRNTRIIMLREDSDILGAYQSVYNGKNSDRYCGQWRNSIVVEFGDYYGS